MGFLVPAFAAFAALAAVPILIHLYGRPRAVRRPFAALRFLLESDRKTAARRRIQEILLLAARAAAIAAVPLLLAKPYVEARSQMAGGIGQSEGAVIVLDDSRSMNVRAGRIGAGTKPAINRRTHLGREVGGIDDVLDADRNAAQRTGICRARRLVATDERPDIAVLAGDCIQRLPDRRGGRKLIPFDAALKIGKRNHERFPVSGRFTKPPTARQAHWLRLIAPCG